MIVSGERQERACNNRLGIPGPRRGHSSPGHRLVRFLALGRIDRRNGSVWPRRAAVSAIAVAALANLIRPTDPHPPAGFVAVDTHVGPISHGAPNPLAEYRATEEIQQEALSRHATVIVFPETVVHQWTRSGNRR